MVQDFLLKSIVFLIPTQFGLHFWPAFSRLNGIKLDYYSPTLYLVDCLILLYLSLNYRYLLKTYLRHQTFLTWSLSLVLLNLFFSLNQPNTFFQDLRLLEYLSLYFVLQKEVSLWSKISTVFKFSFLLVVGLQFGQQLLQKSLNGPFFYLGERFFTGTTPSLPHFNFQGQSYLRVSSTFSHPNSLAGYLVLVFLIFQRNLTSSSFFFKFLNLLSLALTSSKAAIFSLLTIFTNFKPQKGVLLIFFILSYLQLFLPVTNTGNFSLDSRTAMIANFKKLPPRYFFSGVGLGNYPTAISQILPGSMNTVSNFQPIHNLFLLSTVELGLPLTLLAFYYLLKKTTSQNATLLVLILFTGLFDHYWFTLPQNKLILVLSLLLV